MPTLYITEFDNNDRSHDIAAAPAASQPSLVSQAIAINGVSAQSSAFNDCTNLVRVATDTTCSIKFGTTPVVTTTEMRLSADSVEYFRVPVGQLYKIAVIANS